MQNLEHKERPIGVFDSGIGGLTVVKEIRKVLPKEAIIYFGDSARVPYGTKSKETILRFAREDVKFLQRFNVKVIVAACFSVSSNALEELRKETSIPIIGMIGPGINNILEKSYKKIGIIGTQATITSKTFERVLKNKLKGIKIYSKACPLFVPLVEEGWFSGKVPELVAEEYLAPLLDNNIEALILACTHYPLLYPTIKKIIGEKVDIIEPGKEVAIFLKKFLENNNLIGFGRNSLSLYFSDIPRDFRKIIKNFLGTYPRKIHLVNVEN
ncbi:MAG: glutamate racemase [candidate division WOR-3 bacterium]